jgi:hypothetical protein
VARRWAPTRQGGSNDTEFVRLEIVRRLDKLLQANITVVAGAGPGLGILCGLPSSSPVPLCLPHAPRKFFWKAPQTAVPA